MATWGNFMMRLGMLLSFPLFFVFQRVGFMLPVFPHVEH